MSTDNTGLTFANATPKQKNDYNYDVTVNGLASLAKWIYKLVDDAADAPWMVADFTTNTLADVTGNQDLRTNFSWTEWFMDKWGKWAKKIKDKISELTHSDLRDTNEWKLFYDMAEATWEVIPTLVWGWPLVKATTKIVNPKVMVESLKKIPGAVDELKILLWKWWKVTQWKVAELYAKYFGEPGSSKAVKFLSEKFPKTSAAIWKVPSSIKAWAIAWWATWLVTWAADAIDDDSNDIVENTTNAKPTDNKPTDTKPTDGTITLPENNPDTIEAKKKELQALKEKNAGTLNAATSVQDLLQMLWAENVYNAREKIFNKLIPGEDYQGTREQNIKLKALVEEMFAKWTLDEVIQPLKR